MKGDSLKHQIKQQYSYGTIVLIIFTNESYRVLLVGKTAAIKNINAQTNNTIIIKKGSHETT